MNNIITVNVISRIDNIIYAFAIVHKLLKNYEIDAYISNCFDYLIHTKISKISDDNFFCAVYKDLNLINNYKSIIDMDKYILIIQRFEHKPINDLLSIFNKSLNMNDLFLNKILLKINFDVTNKIEISSLTSYDMSLYKTLNFNKIINLKKIQIKYGITNKLNPINVIDIN
jgi:hypothetical protein